LNKIKGTRRSVNAILNIYGIPSSIITIQEYGGTGNNNSSYINNAMSLYTMQFSGSHSLKTNNIYSDISNSNG
jgi:hypothetical protein